jgi:hypothetical protein
MRAWWRHISDPSLWPNARLFFELYGQAIQGRPHTAHMLDGIIEDWLEPAAEINMTYGLSRGQARDHARLGIAVTRGLLLDLVATGDVEAVNAAMDASSTCTPPGCRRATSERRTSSSRANRGLRGAGSAPRARGRTTRRRSSGR